MGLFVDAHDAENDVLLEANAAIDLMKKKGATEADCKDLAKTSCEEVEKERANDQRLINKIKVTKAANFRVHFASQIFRTMKPGHCGFIFGSRNYLTARAKYNQAIKLEIAWKGRTSEAWKMVVRMKMVAAKMVKKCYCATKKSYYLIYKTVTRTTRIAR